MQQDILESALRKSGDLAGVFEYDGETAYFYLYDLREANGHKILDSIHVLSGDTDLGPNDVCVQWDQYEERVGLFMRGTEWAVFNVNTGEKFGGDCSQKAEPEIPVVERFDLR